MARNGVLSIILFAALHSTGFAQSGKVFDDLSMNSDILGGERKYAIYLPPDYDSSQRRYPVLYLLHGSGDDQTGWVQFGEVHSIANRAILMYISLMSFAAKCPPTVPNGVICLVTF